MTARWIRELKETPAIMDMSPASWEREVLPILERINYLLRLAAINTHDMNLYDLIREETGNELNTGN